jgi:uncharacterized protein
MDTLLIIFGILFLLVGIVGCIIPMLPGPPLAYLSLVLLQLTAKAPFDANFMILWALITIGVTLLDFWVPIYGTIKFGGTKTGARGAAVGLIVGLFFLPPIGLIIGPFAGAFIGELIAGQPSNLALKSAIGSFIGFVAGTLMKIAVCLVIGYYFFVGWL